MQIWRNEDAQPRSRSAAIIRRAVSAAPYACCSSAASTQSPCVLAAQMTRVIETEALGLALGAAESVAVFAGQAAVLATIAGHHAEPPPIVA